MFIKYSKFQAWTYCCANQFFVFSSLLLLQCKLTFKIFRLGLIAAQIEFQNFRAWPHCIANRLLKFPSLALLRCTLFSYDNRVLMTTDRNIIIRDRFGYFRFRIEVNHKVSRKFLFSDPEIILDDRTVIINMISNHACVDCH